MISTYNSMFMSNGVEQATIPGRTPFFIPYTAIMEDGTFTTYVAGDAVVREPGVTFIVDSWIPDQFEKLKVDISGSEPILTTKDGMEVIDPRSEQEKLIAQKELELMELKAQKR